MRQVLVGVVVASFTISPLSAQSLNDSIAREATRAAQDPGSTGGGKMSPGFKWTGIALLGAGAWLIIRGATAQRTGQYCILDDCTDAATLRTIWLIEGTAAAGAGGVVLAIGASKARQSSPSVSFGPHGLVIRQVVPLGLGGVRPPRPRR